MDHQEARYVKTDIAVCLPACLPFCATKEAENYFYRKFQRNVKSKIVRNISLVTIIINLNFHTYFFLLSILSPSFPHLSLRAFNQTTNFRKQWRNSLIKDYCLYITINFHVRYAVHTYNTACIVSILEIIENCLLSLMADHISSSEMYFILFFKECDVEMP